jgi:hypothetical protein
LPSKSQIQATAHCVSRKSRISKYWRGADLLN